MYQLVSIFYSFDFIAVDIKMTILGTLASKANVHNIVSLVIESLVQGSNVQRTELTWHCL